LVPVEKRIAAVRAVIRLDIHKTQKSCGYGVPVMQFIEERKTMDQWGRGLIRKVCSVVEMTWLIARLDSRWILIRIRIIRTVWTVCLDLSILGKDLDMYLSWMKLEDGFQEFGTGSWTRCCWDG